MDARGIERHDEGGGERRQHLEEAIDRRDDSSQRRKRTRREPDERRGRNLVRAAPENQRGAEGQHGVGGDGRHHPDGAPEVRDAAHLAHGVRGVDYVVQDALVHAVEQREPLQVDLARFEPQQHDVLRIRRPDRRRDTRRQRGDLQFECERARRRVHQRFELVGRYARLMVRAGRAR